jgi:NhaP-type Na+/H+ or K+/H+ antiporter
VVLPWLAFRVEASRFFSVAGSHQPLFAFSLGLLVYALTSLTHVNEYLAAFAAGVTVATLRADLREEFNAFGELLVELLKLAALLVFGTLISPVFLTEISGGGYLFAAVALLLVRPAALGLAMLGAKLGWREQLAASWFGPKGFASVVYGLLLLQSGVPGADRLFHLVALVVAASILAHSSTDVLVAGWFRKAEAETG